MQKSNSEYITLYINKSGICKRFDSNVSTFNSIQNFEKIVGANLKEIFYKEIFSAPILDWFTKVNADFSELLIEDTFIHYIVTLQPLKEADTAAIITLHTSEISKQIDILKYKYEGTLENSNVGLWLWFNLEEDQAWWSPSFLKLLGYENDNVKTSMQLFMQLIHPEQLEDFKNRMKNFYRSTDVSAQPYNSVEFKMRKKNGEYLDLLFSSRQIKNAAGKIIKFSGTVIDINKLKSVEKKLSESESRLELALEAANMGTWSWNIKRNEIFWSEQVLYIFGIKPEEFKGDFESYLNLIPSNERVQVEEYITNVLAKLQKEFFFDHSIQTPSGVKKRVYCKGKLYADHAGMPDSMTGVVLDVTQENELKYLLGQTTERYKSVIESMIEGIIIIDLEGKIIDHNKAATQIIGYEDLVLIGNDFSLGPGEAIREDETKFPFEEFPGIKTLRTGMPYKNVILGWIIPGKDTIWLSINSEPVKNENGEQVAVVCSYSDVTERQVYLHTLKVKNRQLEDFAHITSHNLRSPISNLSVLLDYYETSKIDAEKEDYFSKLKHVSANLLSTIQVLADSLKIQKDFIDDEDDVSFQEIFDTVSNLLYGNIQESAVMFRIDFSKCNQVYYSPTYLQSIFINLISNAIKYRATDRKLIVHIETEISEKGNVLLKFSDNGIGIDLEKHQHKIFGLYKTFHANKDSRGVGLYMTKRQIETMGGSIEVTSKVNVGTTFTIKF
ncbi:PAS domain-containing sensor histidine kinase [Cytophaga hutchinsonii]|uniref:histidine kinase n=1 Tax=Cytophaga hutchinsonii (strain ATCC 33406 / DSM 1761 / CIP 103989 / NBRC 15051 / NCIMB 9469 / D465) TaxID=269798 RepID=A0A6N4SVQ6_CYTH3|nr:PAS domain S-box protein [Cytophaga hutchinsonii]ABG60457.1 two-component sensor histidine kinase [Cytophaga hutchinsonii ATCC 33406]SFX85549.1 hypothetical protein SAMN04487930_11162 [Cytophaga hutchinsonii ATCC 33406]